MHKVSTDIRLLSRLRCMKVISSVLKGKGRNIEWSVGKHVTSDDQYLKRRNTEWAVGRHITTGLMSYKTSLSDF